MRRVLREAGIAAVRKRGVKRHYKRRERKAQEGSLLLWDGSPRRWFGEKFGEWSLMAAIDDATGKLVCGVFARQEDAQSYLICLRQIVLENGIPLAMYMDRHGIFRRNDDHWTVQEQLAGQQTPTQVTQALLAFGIKPIFALSPQAKGRVERLFNTLQDRLVQELGWHGSPAPTSDALCERPVQNRFQHPLCQTGQRKPTSLASSAQNSRCRSDLQFSL